MKDPETINSFNSKWQKLKTPRDEMYRKPNKPKKKGMVEG